MKILDQVRRGEPLEAWQVKLLNDMYQLAKDPIPNEAELAEELILIIESIFSIHETLTNGGYPRSDFEYEPRAGNSGGD